MTTNTKLGLAITAGALVAATATLLMCSGKGSEIRKGWKQQGKKLTTGMKQWMEDKLEKMTEAGEKFIVKAPVGEASH